MLEDSAKIAGRDAATLSIYFGKEIEPLYDMTDVNGFIDLIEEVDFKTPIKINDNLTIEYIPSGHIINAAQIILWITSGNTTKKILYTSDLGNRQIPKYYVEPFEPVEGANLVIGETTYGDAKRNAATLTTRKKDLIKMHEIIQNTCLHNRHKVLIPVFALDRAQMMLTLLYEMFGEDSGFNIPVIFDSPLGQKHLKSYFNLIENEEELNLLKKALAWRNVVQVNEWTESKYWSEYQGPCVILASSGMMQNGRITTYLPTILSHWENHILFCGFLSEGSLGWKIKQKDKYISLNGKHILNQCRISSLNSFSSHMQYVDLLDYYSNLNCEKIALVHGEQNTKIQFMADLQKEIERKNKNSKVIAVNKSTVIHL